LCAVFSVSQYGRGEIAAAAAAAAKLFSYRGSSGRLETSGDGDTGVK
jgi:hypothetical protein